MGRVKVGSMKLSQVRLLKVSSQFCGQRKDCLLYQVTPELGAFLFSLQCVGVSDHKSGRKIAQCSPQESCAVLTSLTGPCVDVAPPSQGQEMCSLWCQRTGRGG
ncbi:Hypothetical predicted protein [Podarcis lilfordi]|uniref:Uncharacterized protein n=1 Tax=Podarcis lilfordi TaxID=74358 RepID=A0AA35PS24_9SAUR|nr:Hypothetical predicted protein [Podarcis lilfordi]